MEPNVREIFSHTDADGDSIRVQSSGPNRLTMSVRESDDGRSHAVYLSRVEAGLLWQSLGNWLDESGSEEATETTLCVRCGHSPESHAGPSTCLGNRNLCGCELSRLECLDPTWAEEATAEPEAWTDAEAPFRPEALRLAVQLAPSGATESAVFSVAEQMVHWLATGERMPFSDAPLLKFIDAEPKPSCALCLHMPHGAGRCAEGGRGLHKCACGEAPAEQTACGVCSHPSHGIAVCADGAPGTAHVDRCQCRGRAEDYQR